MPSTRAKRPKLHDRFSPMKYLVLLAVIIIPSIYSGILTWANYDPTGTIDAVPAAIVNADAPATTATGSTLNLGQDLTDELLSNDSKQNFDWSTMSADEAQTKLENGEVQAVLTIPADFSANVASVSENDAAAAQTAKLTITTNDGSNIISGNIASSLGTAVTDTLARQVSTEYLNNIYAGFTDIHDSLGQAADGASQLADGSTSAKEGSDELVVGLTDLKSGSSELSSGASTLADGATRVNDGASSLASGSASLADGATQVNDGASSLASGAAELNSGASSLATGANSAASGAASLSDGLSQINSAVSALPEQLPALTEGTGALASGADGLASGAQNLEDAAWQLASGATTLSDGADAAVTGAQNLADGAEQLHTATGTLANGAQGLSASSQALIDNWGNLTDEQKLAALQQLNAGASALASGAGAVDTAAGQLATGADTLVGTDSSGLTKLAAGASALDSGATQLASGATSLSDGADALSQGAATLNSKAGTLSTSLGALVTAISQANDGAASLASGTSTLASGASTLADGTGSLSSGASTLAEGTSSLASGSATLNDGAQTLAEGTSSLSSGATSLASGAATLDEGAGSAVDGASSLASGLNELEDGNTQLATSLGDAVGQVPSYTTDQASELSAVTSDPVTIEKTRLNEVPTYGHGLAPYFMTLGLWVGAIAYFMMYPAISRKFARSGHSGLRTLRGALVPVLLMGILQGTVMSLIIHYWVGIEEVNFWGLTGFAILTSITFLTINQALIALLDAPGRFIALILTVVQIGAAGGTYPIETAPAFLQAIHPWLPLTHALEAFRSLIAGGSIGIATGIAWLLGWIALAVAGTALSIWIRHRREDKAEAERQARRAALASA
ncbi:YhgE/Pip domain-containing protein [Rothia sp. SD9660Na]|uniref:YhgE/Pip domain-containing protein n=1 Tax=Rothia sp. SD9660Na TaxID=3047030 RepID=UPI0024BB1D03|nr:YhgE/Pip domain-containing protein [Rothia sp. SD9660Na]WHS50511.1 YhgE/Pip domain-containing protein [Rothia sp. SD9660Na]